MAAKNELTIDPDLDFFISRTFEAPKSLVYEAWTNPQHMAQWWGPAAFTNPVCNIDLRPGGNYYFTMRSPEGIDYPCSGTYQEIVPNERLVMSIDCADHPEEWYDQVFRGRDKSQGIPQLNMTQTITFEEADGKTTLRIRTRFDSKEIRDALLKVGMSEGWGLSLDRLGIVLADAAGDREITTQRLIKYPPEKVYAAWADPDQLKNWWGPSGFTNTFHEFHFQPGGMWRFTMHSPNGVDHPNEIRFLEMSRPDRIVLDHLTEPHYFRVIATFEPRGNDTFLSFRMIFTSKERFDQAIKYVRPANEQNFDRLEAQLAKSA